MEGHGASAVAAELLYLVHPLWWAIQHLTKSMILGPSLATPNAGPDAHARMRVAGGEWSRVEGGRVQCGYVLHARCGGLGAEHQAHREMWAGASRRGRRRMMRGCSTTAFAWGSSGAPHDQGEPAVPDSRWNRWRRLKGRVPHSHGLSDWDTAECFLAQDPKM